MDLVKLSISRPVSVVVGVLLVVMFGLIGFSAVPVQLAPNVDRPEITVTTAWVGRSPSEIVDEIVKEQEEQLKNVSNLKSMKSTSTQGEATITLEFYIGSDISRALQEVSDKLRQVSDYPEDVDEPAIKAADGASENAIAWIIFDVHPDALDKHPDYDIQSLFSDLDDEVKPYLERVGGVAEVNIFGGREREVRILVDSTRLAQYGLNHAQLLDALNRENINVSAGSLAEGKRDYNARVMGQFEGTQDILDVVISYNGGSPISVRDVAEVEIGLEKRRGFVRSLGYPAIAMNVIRQSDANVVEIMEELRLRLEEVEAEILPRLGGDVGPDLRMRQVYDETTYISSAISLVTQNLWVGGSIAVLVLLLFLRSVVATGVIAVAIPVSVVGTFLILLLLGRTLNVISLAGLAFATGMVVDNAIVVLENIFRHREMGKSPSKAALDGGREVVGAVIAATLTTVAVFIPILTIQEEAGQLFRDISLAIVASVSLSLVLSITVIPMACAKLLGEKREAKSGGVFAPVRKASAAVGEFYRLIGEWLYWLMTSWRGYTLRPALIVVMTVVSLGGAALLMPPLDYLPAGNRNLVFGGLLIPPGTSVEQMTEIAKNIEDAVDEYFAIPPGDPKLATLPKIVAPYTGVEYDPVGIENVFVGSFGGGMFAGATSTDESVVKPLGSLLSSAFSTTPDILGGAAQSSLFGRGVGAGASIDLEILGPDLDRVVGAAERLFNAMGQDPRFGFGNVRPDPGNFNLDRQEYQIRVTRLGRELGVRARDAGVIARSIFDGAFAGDFQGEEKAIDMRVLPMGGRLFDIATSADVPVATPAGPIVPFASVVEMSPGLAPQDIRRIEELPAVTLGITTPEGMPLEEAMNIIRDEFVQPLLDDGTLDRTMRARLEGSAAQLDEVKSALLGPPYGGSSGGGLGSLVRSSGLIGAAGFLLAGGAVVLVGLLRKKPTRPTWYSAIGVGLVVAIVLTLLAAVSMHPVLAGARFIWALAVVYLLMCALFESFVYPFVIMFSVPLALVGGFAGLSFVHSWTAANPVVATQNLDVLTMLGFVILVGVVVNNAILIVHQSLNLLRNPEGETPTIERAVSEAVVTRIRPVLMSTMTSVGGMLPLVLFPGAGSELYRGLGSVVVGGLVVSTVFTLVLVPMLFSLVLRMQEATGIVFARSAEGSRSKSPAASMAG